MSNATIRRGTQSRPGSQIRPAAGLLVLCIVPVTAGVARLTQLVRGATITADNARFFASPVPVAIHIVGASLFCVLGIVQFLPAARRRWPRWHRLAGRALVLCGLAAAGSGLWMTLFYPHAPGGSDLLDAMRLLIGTAMATSIMISVVAIRRGQIARHQAWMIRGYALGMGAGTQVLTNVPWLLLIGTPGVFTQAMLMGAGWAINIVVAERVIRTRSTVRRAQDG